MVTQNTTTGAATAARHIQLNQPQANQQIVIDNIAGAALDMAFPSEAAQLEQSGQDLVFLFENGGRIVLSNFFGLFESNQLPAFNLEDGQSLPGDAFLAALREDLLPAAGPGAGAAAGSGGVGDYADDAGNLIGGVDRLDPLGTTGIGTAALGTIEDEAPDAIDTVPTLIMTTSALTVFESNLGDGSSTYQGTTEGPIGVAGSFAITAPDGIGALTVGNSVFTAAQLAALAGGTPLAVDLGPQDAYADMVLTGFDGTNVFFTYTLVEDSTHTLLTPSAEDRIETVTVIITDADGDSSLPGTLTITIADDEPLIGKINDPNPEDEVTPDDYPELGADGVVEHVFTNGEFNLNFDLTNGSVPDLDNGIVDLRVGGGTPYFREGTGLGVTYDGNHVPGDSPDRENELGHRDDKWFHEQEAVVFKLAGVADAFSMATSAFYGHEGGSGEVGKVLFFLGDELVDSKTLFASDETSYNFTNLGLFDRVVIIGLDYQNEPSVYRTQGHDGGYGHDGPSVGDSSDFYITSVGFHLVSEVGVAHGDLDFTYGADDRGLFDLSFAGVATEVIPEGGSEGEQILAAVESPSEIWTTDGEVVTVVTTAEGLVVGFIGDAPESLDAYANAASALAQSNVAFVLSVDPDTGYWTFTQKALLDLPEGSGGTLNFNYTITDADGDTAGSSFSVTVIEAERTPDIDMPTEPHVVHESGLFTPWAIGTDAGHDAVVASGTFVVDMQQEDFASVTVGGKTFASLDDLDAAGPLFIGANGLVVNNPLLAHAVLDVTGVTYDEGTGKYTVAYKYTLYDNVNHTFPDGTETGDVIPISVTDASGDSAYASLTITIVDDVPIAHDNVAWVTEDGGRDWNPYTDDEASGNVITGNIFFWPELGDDQQGADGAKVSNIKFGFHSEGVDANGEHINGLYGTLFIKADGSYTYELNNHSDAVQHLIPGETLKEVFTYTLKDGDGDTDTAKLTIIINGANDKVEIGCINSLQVNEDDLPYGSDFHKESLTDYGQFIVTANDGLNVVKINGESVIINGDIQADHTIDTPYGNLVVYDVDYLGDGKYRIEYKFTLDDNAPHSNGNGENDYLLSLGLAVSDRNGDWDTASINVHITDDVPTAYDNVATVTEDGGHDWNPHTDDEAEGNVITGNIFWLPEAGDDVQGADGAKVSNIQFGGHSESVDTNGETINGLYGKLFIKADGTYTYELNNGNDAVQHLIPGETLKEVFTYTLKDGDGDTDTAKLTITINGANDKVDIGCINSLHVNEDDLPYGSDFPKDSLTDSSSFVVNANDGLDALQLTLGGVTKTVYDDGALKPGAFFDSPYGNLVITSVQNLGDGNYKVSYKFTLDDNAPHATGNGENDYQLSFGVKAIDRNGDADTGTIEVHIKDDVPTAYDNFGSVTEDGNSDGNPHTGQSDSGNVVTGNFFWHEAGDDVQGADGAIVSKIQFGASSVNVDSNGETINGLYGTLLVKADGTYTYTLNNGNAAVQHLTTGEHLEEVFTYTLKDGDGDIDTAKLTITIDGADDKVSLTGLCGSEGTVYEAGLSDGSHIGFTATSFNGDFFVEAKDGLDEIRIEGVKVIDNGVLTGNSFTNAYGTIVVTAFDAATGKVSYTYTLTDNITHNASGDGDSALSRDFTVTAVDRDGDADYATLTVKIVDDNPDAFNNTASVTEDSGAGQQATGNLITDHPIDVQGADGAKVSFVEGSNWKNVDADGETINGQYGTLFVKADGTYTYTLNNSSAAVQTLTTGEKLYDTFTYTLKDGDTDSDNATLKITINGADDGVTLTNLTPAAQGGELTVNENDLPDGSSPNSGALTQYGTFNVSAPDGLDEVWVGGVKVVDNGALYGSTSQRTIDTAYGNVVVTAFNAGTGEVSYKFTLDDNAPHTGAGADPYFLNLAVEARDTDSPVADVATGTLSIQIVDDIPDAKDNVGSVTEDSLQLATGNLISNAPADVKGADGATISHIAGSTSANVDADGETINGQYGTLFVKADGTYSYTLDNSNGTVQALNNGQTLHDVFTYTLKDGDGDIDTAKLDITIDGHTDSYVLNLSGLENPEGTVHEAGLPDGSGTDGVGLGMTGAFTITATAGLDEVSIGGTKVIDGGALFGSHTVDTANGNLVVDGVNNNGDGTYTVNYHFTLDDNATHPAGGTLSLAVEVSDNFTAGTPNATGTLNINIVDDHPTAVDDNATYNPVTTNVVVVLDRSGSMNEYADGSPGNGHPSRLDVAIDSLEQLLNAYDDLGAVNVKLVWFAGSAGSEEGWLMGKDAVQDAIDILKGLSTQNSTNYDAALDEVMSELASGLPAASRSVVYFLSDGEPNSPDNSEGINGTEQAEWETFLSSKGFDMAYAFGIGTGIGGNIDELEPIGWTPAAGDGDAGATAIITDMSQLATYLLATVPTSGYLLSNDQGGADGGKTLFSVTFDGEEYVKADADPSTHVLTLTLPDGKGTLTIDFDDGSYKFIPGQYPVGSAAIQYTIVDADGTESNTATLNLTLNGNYIDAHDNYANAPAPGSSATTEQFNNDSHGWSTDGYGSSGDDDGHVVRTGGELQIALTANNDSIATSKSFTVAAGETVSFDWRTVVTGTGSHDNDRLQVEISGGGGTTTLYTVGNGDLNSGTFSKTFATGGTYTITVRVVDGTSGNSSANNSSKGLEAYIDDVMFTHAIAGAALLGNVITDEAGSDLADQIVNTTATVTEVNGEPIGSSGADITGDYGTLHINPDGSYEYHANAGVAAGHDDAFVYKLSSAADSDYATLNIHIGSGEAHLQATAESWTGSGSANDFHLGTTGGDTLNGGDGNDVIFGNYGNDIIHGNAGHDILHGNAGNDTLYGDAGNDILVGGQGSDTLHGGADADTFVWNAEDFTTSAVDRVTDFNMGDGDVLRFSDVLIGNNPDVVAGGALSGTDSNDVVVTLHSGANVQHVVIQDALVGAPDTSAALNAIEQHILNNKIITENS